MAKVVIVVNQNGFHSDEINLLQNELRRVGHSLKIASLTRSRLTSSDGKEFMPDLAIYEVNPNYFDALVVAGEGAKELSANRNVISLVRNMMLKGKVVGGITDGPLVLAGAGILGGRRATVYPDKNSIKELTECNARYEEKHVVCDGNILTADDPESSGEFVKEIIKMLG